MGPGGVRTSCLHACKTRRNLFIKSCQMIAVHKIAEEPVKKNVLNIHCHGTAHFLNLSSLNVYEIKVEKEKKS